MPIGISDDHVELADAFGKWAGSLGGDRGGPRRPRTTRPRRSPRVGGASPRWGWPAIAVPEATAVPAARCSTWRSRSRRAADALVPGPLLGTAVASVALGEPAGPVASGQMRVALGTGLPTVVHDAPGATHALVVRGRRGRCSCPLDGVDLDAGRLARPDPPYLRR